MKKLLLPILLLFGALLTTSCSDDDAKDITNEISMTVSSETGIMYPPFFEEGIECMLVMTDDHPGEWQQLDFEGIKGFTYERGHEYQLRVIRTILANPPADSYDRTYTLKTIISDNIVATPEIPIETEIKSEDGIEYQALCPIKKYDITHDFIVNTEGNIYDPNNDPLPSYDHARIYLQQILSKEDPNWVKFQSVPYQATYSYVFSPLSDTARLIRNERSGPMFKNVISQEEFNYVTQTMNVGEKLTYTLILANVHKKAIQKLEFTITKR